MQATIPANYWRALMRLANSDNVATREKLRYAFVEQADKQHGLEARAIIATDGWSLLRCVVRCELEPGLRIRTPVPNRKVDSVVLREVSDQTAHPGTYQFLSAGAKTISGGQVELGKLNFPDWREVIGEDDGKAMKTVRFNPELLATVQRDLLAQARPVELRHTAMAKRSPNELTALHIKFDHDDTVDFWLMPCR